MITKPHPVPTSVRLLPLLLAAAVLATGCTINVGGPGDAGAPGDPLPEVSTPMSTEPVVAPPATEPPATTPPATEVPTTTVPPTTVPPTTVPPTTVPSPTVPPPVTTQPPPPPPPPVPTTTQPPPPVPTTTQPPPTTIPRPPTVSVHIELKGEGSLKVNGKRIDGTGTRIGSGTEEIGPIDITENLVDGSNKIQIQYVRIKILCDPYLKVSFRIGGSKVETRNLFSGDCIFEWNWTVDRATGELSRSRDSG